MRHARRFFALAMLLASFNTIFQIVAQTPAQATPQASAAATASEEKLRVFITDSQSWETRYSAGGSGRKLGSTVARGSPSTDSGDHQRASGNVAPKS